VKKSQQEPLLGANVISAVFNVVKHNTCSTPIIEALASTISRAVNNSCEDRDYFAKNNAMPVILFMLKQLSANAKITMYAADMLSAILLVHTNLASQFVDEMMGIPLICKLLQEHSLEERTCGSLLKCLSVVLQVKKEGLQVFIQVSGGLDTFGKDPNEADSLMSEDVDATDDVVVDVDKDDHEDETNQRLLTGGDDDRDYGSSTVSGANDGKVPPIADIGRHIKAMSWYNFEYFRRDIPSTIFLFIGPCLIMLFLCLLEVDVHGQQLYD